jgi:hypothetical protein
MEQLDPQLPPDQPFRPDGLRTPPPLEVLPPSQSPADKFKVVRDLWANGRARISVLAATLWGKVAIGAVAAGLVGGTAIHVFHRTPPAPVPPPVVQPTVTPVAPPVHHRHVHKRFHHRKHANRTPSKTSSSKKHPAHKKNRKPWLSK